MKKSATYYFVMLALANFLIARCLFRFNDWMLWSWDGDHRGEVLPWISTVFFHHSQWPYVVVGLALLGAVVSVSTEISSSRLCHFVIALFAIDTLVLFVTIFAYAAPFVRTLYPLSPLP